MPPTRTSLCAFFLPDDNKIRTLVNLVGGDGSMNVPNWSPDSKSLAFVSYQMLPAEDNGSTE